MGIDKRIKVSRAQWEGMGVRLFGPDKMKWRFVCPSCGFVASVLDWKKVGASVNEVAYSCVGRHLLTARPAFHDNEGPGPCTYAGGGLFRINPILIDGKMERFDFYREKEGKPWPPQST